MIKSIDIYAEIIKGEMKFRTKLMELIMKRNEVVSKALDKLEK